MNRFLAISPQSQFWLFNFALALNILGMVLTDMWLPMVAGAMIMTGLAVEAWIRVAHIIPMRKELRSIQHQLDNLQQRSRDSE